MKFVIIALAVIGTTEALTCVTGTDGSAAAIACEGSKCSRPTFTEYTGFAADVTYKCEACVGTTKADKKCEECATDACNAAPTTGADFKCHSYEVTADENNVVSIKKKDDVTTCKRLAATAVKCNMPTATSTKTTYTSASGCGPCDATQKSGNTCAECDAAECNVMTPIKCVQGTDGAAAATDCPLTATTCFQPKFIEYTGFATGVNYGCGACPSGSTDKTCSTCAGKTDDGCNKPEAVGADFKCNSWTWDDATAKYKLAEATCKRKAATKVVCNMPAEGATKTSYTSTTGCGPCKAEEKDKAKGCKECTTALCNKAPDNGGKDDGKDDGKDKKDSATSVTALLMPLLAMTYTLY